MNRNSAGWTYASQKLAIDYEESFAANRYIQVVDLRQELLLGKVQLFIVASPKCELLNVFDQFRFLKQKELLHSSI